MKAAVVEAPARARICTTPKPELREGSVRLRLEGCGVCGSNLPAWEGRPWFRYPLAPGELGHEGWGWVDEIGPNVTSVKRGARVAVLSYRAFAEYDIAHEDAMAVLPEQLDGIPFPGEALGCAMNVFQRSAIQSGQTVAVVGVGFLGAVLVALAAQAGTHVLAISRRPFALEIARACGAAETIAFDDPQKIIQRVQQLTDGRGCDRVIEAVGQQAALNLAAELTCERGRLIIAGFHQDGLRQINLQLWNWRGLDVINAHERDPAIYLSGLRSAISAVTEGRLNLAPLLTHRFSLDRIGDAFNAMRERPHGFLKAFVTL